MQARLSPPYEGGDQGVVINKKKYNLILIRKEEAKKRHFEYDGNIQ